MDVRTSGWQLFGRLWPALCSRWHGLGAEFRVNTWTADDQAVPSIASLDDGGFVITWHSMDQDGGNFGIFGQRYSADGAAIGLEFQINSNAMFNQRFPSVTGLKSGGFVVSWASNQDGSGYGVYGQIYAANGAAVGTEFQINTMTANYQHFPSITALADGGFVATWMSEPQNGAGYGIYGQRYDANGAKSGTEFLINSNGASFNHDTPSVTGLADGGFVVTWSSSGQDGSGYGVYSQLFATNISTSEDTAKTILASALLANDTDANGDVLTITAVSAMSAKGAAVSLVNGNVVYNPSGVASFQTMAAGAQTTDTFTYTISDGKGGTSTATVAMTVTGANDAAFIGNPTVSGVTEDTPVMSGNLVATGSISIFDMDAGDNESFFHHHHRRQHTMGHADAHCQWLL